MNSTHQIPKAEIHIHLEATITPDLCRKFASKNNVNLPADIFGNKYAYEWSDFYDFIKKYDYVDVNVDVDVDVDAIEIS